MTARLRASVKALSERTPGGPGMLALLMAMIIWGASFLVTKSALTGMGPLTVLSLRFGSAFLLLLPFAWARGYRLRLSVAPRFLLFGITGIVLHNGLETSGLVYTSSAAAAMVSASLPALTAAASVWLLRERISLTNGIGIVISFAGVLLVAGVGPSDAGPLALLGNAMVLGGLIAWVAYTVQTKKMSSDQDVLVATIAGIGSALLFLVPLTVWEIAATGAPRFTGAGLASIAYLGALASAVAYWLWNHALTQMDASIAAPYLNLIPAIAVVLALAFGESVPGQQLVGGAIVGLGVWLSGRRTRPRRCTLEADPA